MKLPDKEISKKKSTPVADASRVALDFFAEAGLLKRVKRSGWWVTGIKDPESVAEHCFRCAVIGHYLAHIEAVDPYKVLVMTLFNDIHESRINDLHKMGHYYIDFKAAESRVFADQVAPLPKEVKDDLTGNRSEYEVQDSPESVVARDADILECLLQAKEYCDQGHDIARTFFKRAPDHLRTATAKRLWRKMKIWDSSRWWQMVVKFDR